MLNPKFCPEGIIKELNRVKQNNYLAKRLINAKPAINISLPSTYGLFDKNKPKSHEKGNLSK